MLLTLAYGVGVGLAGLLNRLSHQPMPIVYIGVFSTFGIGAAILLHRSPAQLADRLSTSTSATDERST